VFRPPSDTAPSTAAAALPTTATAVEGLLRDLGPQLRRGGATAESTARLATGIPEIDRLLGGGFPRGRLSEIAGAASSGRTSLALALLAGSTGAGEVAAVVDCADAFDPGSAQSAGVLLDRVLWARTPRTSQALRCAERLLEAHGFALVLLDLAIPDLRSVPATALRLARRAESTGTALVVLTRTRALGTAAEVAIELALARTRFTGTPALLEGLDVQVSLVRHRNTPGPRHATVRLRTTQAA
jgi:RecA/RadA recombinase